MAIQLKEAPKIKITLRNGDLFSDVAPNYYFDSFHLKKKLLEPNCFTFEVWRDDLVLEDADFKFNLRDELLGAKVECSLIAKRYDDEQEEDVEDEVENFFYGYIQNIKVIRKGVRTPATFRCTAFSPDSRLKQFKTCSSRFGVPLAKYVADIIYSPSENTCKYDVSSGRYDDQQPMEAEINPRYTDDMPYTVQYHESGYDFLVRLAKRYGEFFYYEDSCLHFGEMKEYDPIHMRTGIDLERYNYDINMNDHLGTALSEYDYDISDKPFTSRTWFKWGFNEWEQEVESPHEMAQSAFDRSMEYFNDENNTVIDLHSARILKEKTTRNAANPEDHYVDQQYVLLEQYVMADSLICNGVARRAVLKLGSVIVIEDETHTGPGDKPDVIEHEPLKVIEVHYDWNSHKGVLNLVNRFKAIPQKSQVPPYLQRDKYGFLTYGDFDIFPYSGPQMGVVVDNNDPLGLGRVRVAMQWQINQEISSNKTDTQPDFHNMEFKTYWIRVAQPYSGNDETGSYLVPEILDEVIVAFEHNNAERPYVAGLVHSNFFSKVDPVWSEEGSVKNNEFKAFRTRNGHTIEIRDKDENGYIKIYDNKTHNYVVTLDTDSKKISLESRGNIELSADNNIVLNAHKNIIMKAGEEIEGNANEFFFDIKDDARIYSDYMEFHSLDKGFFVCSKSNISMYAFVSDIDDECTAQSHMRLVKDGAALAYTNGNQDDTCSNVVLDKEGAYLGNTLPDGNVCIFSRYNNVDIYAKAKDVTLSAGNNVKISPVMDLKLEGFSMKAEGFTSISIQGTATDIKGTPLKLN